MKKILICSLLVIMSMKGFCQQLDSATLTRKTTLLLKSKQQKNTGLTLIACGGALIGVGLLIGNRKNSSFSEAGAGFVLGGLGIVSVLVGLPILGRSSGIKRNAEAMVSINLLQTQIVYAATGDNTHPGVEATIKFHF